MVNKRFSALALALAALMAVAGLTPVAAQSANGYVEQSGPTPLAAVAIGVNAGWSATTTVPPAFFWSGTPPVFADCSGTPCEFTFTVGADACVSLTDDFAPGDRFTAYDFGGAIGTTPLVPTGGPDIEHGPDVAYFDPAYSSDTFVVAAGSHSISIEVIPPSLTVGRAYIRVDTVGSFGPCDDLLKPDLVVSSMTHDPPIPTTEDQIEFTATVENVGSTSAPASTLSFKIGGESPSDPDALFAIPALASGESETVVRTVQLELAQNYLNTAVADFNDDVDESDEGNNTTTDSYTVVDATGVLPLVYQIVTLPQNGTIQGVSGPCSVPSPCDLPSSNIVYEPNPGFTGLDFFDFQVFDPNTGLTSPIARVDLTVVAPPGSGVGLTVNFLGSGVGDVTMAIGGSVVAICSTDCTESFGPGDIVKLHARPIENGTFGGWGGACSIGGTSQIVTITLPSSGGTVCSATFNP